MLFKTSGMSGLKLSRISIGFWYSWNNGLTYEQARDIATTAFENHINHYDLANSQGALNGAAEFTFAKILQNDLGKHRDHMVIATKCGRKMWEGPTYDSGSRKYVISSCEQSLRRLGTDYVDIFYHHRPDRDTPVEETMGALAQLVRQGKALYIGLSCYPARVLKEAVQILDDMGVPCLVHQSRYNMLEPFAAKDIFPLVQELGLGSVVYSPLAQGKLSEKFINSPPRYEGQFRHPSGLSEEQFKECLRPLLGIAQARGQTLAQMAFCWSLSHPAVTSAILGVARNWQIIDAIKCLDRVNFSDDENAAIEAVINSIHKTGNADDDEDAEPSHHEG